VIWGVVVPSIRPEGFVEFLRAWTPLFRKHWVRLYVVWDLEKRPDLPGYNEADLYEIWQEGSQSERPDFIPRGTDMCRSWGFYQAWRDECDFTLSLDDDVRPGGRDIFEEYESEFGFQRPNSPYLDVGAFTSIGLPMRGFPYADRHAQTVVQYGGWKGVPDLDAVTQLRLPPLDETFFPLNIAVPRGAALTTCAMNFAFLTQYTPIMWQLPMLEGRYNRMGDIWSGLIQKRVLDAAGLNMVLNGMATVAHERASDPFQNLRREAPGLGHNEALWKELQHGFRYVDILDEFRRVTNEVIYYFFGTKGNDVEYADHFREARNEWLRLFS